MSCAGVDVDAARNRERLMMMDDANRWLASGKYAEKPHDKTGAMALHIAAAKGYADVIKSVLSCDVCSFFLDFTSTLVVQVEQLVGHVCVSVCGQ